MHVERGRVPKQRVRVDIPESRRTVLDVAECCRRREADLVGRIAPNDTTVELRVRGATAFDVAVVVVNCVVLKQGAICATTAAI